MSSGHNNMVERRDFLKGLGVAAGGALTVGTASAVVGLRTSGSPEAGISTTEATRAATEQSLVQDTGRTAEGQNPELALSPEVTQFLGDLKAGTQLGRWKIEAIHAVRNGALPVTMSDASGTQFQVDVLRRDGSEQGVNGVGNTDGLSVFVLNGGNGSKSTEEEWGLGALALAAELARRESLASAPGLLTWRERAHRFPRGAFRVG